VLCSGFGGLLIAVFVSYLSHSQVWALQRGRDVMVSGTSNRAIVSFQEELGQLLDAMPEAPPPPQATS
jgi:cytochrome c biogenesis protein